LANVKLPKIRDKVMPGRVKFAGVEVTFDYKPGRIDGEYDRQMREAQIEANTSGDPEQMYDVICTVLTKWNLADDNDKVIPLNGKAIKEAGVPRPLLVMIENYYEEDARNGSIGVKK
jgi:hypothetical protein